MGVVTGLTAIRMLAIEAASVVGGYISGGHLILTKHDGSTIDAGDVTGPPGVDATAPSGAVVSFAGSAAPTGWLLCDGASLLRNDYPTLFAIIGTTYGSVDSTHFTLPNLKGRIPVGLDSAQTEFDALGETGGAKTHALATTEIPAHAHTMKNHTHSGTSSTVSANHNHGFTTGDVSNTHLHRSRTVNMYPGTSGTIWQLHTLSAGGTQNDVVDLAGNHTHSGTTGNQSADHTHTLTTGGPNDNTSDSAGGGGAHNNLQPYIVMNYIIKT